LSLIFTNTYSFPPFPCRVDIHVYSTSTNPKIMPTTIIAFLRQQLLLLCRDLNWISIYHKTSTPKWNTESSVKFPMT